MVSAQRVTVSTSPVALNTPGPSGQRLVIKNLTANAVDLGPSAVAALAGFDLAGNATTTVRLRPGDTLYAIRSGGVNSTLSVSST